MTIRTKIKLCMACAIFLAVSSTLVVFYRGQLLAKSFRERAFFDEVIQGTSELNYLAHGDALYQSDRYKTQWEQRYGSLEKLLREAKLSREDDKAALAKMLHDMRVIKGLFGQVVSNSSSARSLSGAMRKMKIASNERVIARILARAQVMGNNAALLAEANNKRVFVVQRRVFLLILTLSLSMLLLVAFITLVLSRSVIGGLKALQEGAKAVSRGDLDHRITIRSNDEIGGVSRAFNDMSISLRRANQELRKSHDELERQVEERTIELTAANRELESFSYSVSHDLRAPLRHMAGFVELLQKRIEGYPDEKVRHYAEIISAASKKMGMLIDDLLAFSRIGRSEIQMKVVDINSLVGEVVRELADESDGRDIEWKIGRLPDVYGDRSMLRLTFVNLISNAVKFTRPCPHAIIEIACLHDRDGEFTFFIKDNGAGFDMKHKNKLFGVFQRLHHEDEFEGTGIGLANVRRIISRHGGKTWAEGTLGQGATFYFTIPSTEEARACCN